MSLNKLQMKLLEQLMLDVMQSKEMNVSPADMIDEGMYALVAGINKLEFARVECAGLRQRYGELEAQRQELQALRELV